MQGAAAILRPDAKRAAGFVAGRPQGFGLCSVAYCCRIITLGGLSVLMMQASFVELMTMQLVPLEPLPSRKEPVLGAVVSHA
jgi:hypothetical protein